MLPRDLFFYRFIMWCIKLHNGSLLPSVKQHKALLRRRELIPRSLIEASTTDVMCKHNTPYFLLVIRYATRECYFNIKILCQYLETKQSNEKLTKLHNLIYCIIAFKCILLIMLGSIWYIYSASTHNSKRKGN